MEKLDKAYEAIEMLKALGLPVSAEQSDAEVALQFEMEPLVEQMHNKFRLEVTYSQDKGLDIQVVDKKPIQESLFPSASEPAKRQKKYIIRVVYPDGRAFCSKMVWETLVDVVKYAGAERVRALNIYLMGDNLVSPDLNPNERYRVGQKDVGNGLYVCTYSSTDTKYEEIRKINKELGLGLRLEKVML